MLTDRGVGSRLLYPPVKLPDTSPAFAASFGNPASTPSGDLQCETAAKPVGRFSADPRPLVSTPGKSGPRSFLDDGDDVFVSQLVGKSNLLGLVLHAAAVHNSHAEIVYNGLVDSVTEVFHCTGCTP